MEMIDFAINFSASDLAIMFATLLGPILAVQAQKLIEKRNSAHERKVALFEQLMATRAVRLSSEHVRALNMIDIYFYGKGPSKRSKTETKVLEAWKIYHDLLSDKYEPDQVIVWNSRLEDYFIDLMVAMSDDLRYSFDKVQIKRSSYFPVGHSNMEITNEKIRNATLNVLEGKVPLKMFIDNIPLTQEDEEVNKNDVAYPKVE